MINALCLIQRVKEAVASAENGEIIWGRLLMNSPRSHRSQIVIFSVSGRSHSDAGFKKSRCTLIITLSNLAEGFH